MLMRLKLWVEENDKVLFGEGRQKLLTAVEETGSLAGAARQLSMSYRAAWGRIKASEERLGFSLVQKKSSGRRSMQLTDEAKVLMERYQTLQEGVEEYIRQGEADLASNLKLFRAQTKSD